MAAIYSNGGNRWNIFGFNFTKRDALSSVYKISMVLRRCKLQLNYNMYVAETGTIDNLHVGLIFDLGKELIKISKIAKIWVRNIVKYGKYSLAKFEPKMVTISTRNTTFRNQILQFY
jgi:hypothetical protein